MKITNISNHEFRKIKQYIPDNGIGNMECTLYILKSKNRWNKDYKLFKKFNNINGEYFSNKLYIINSLIDIKDTIGIDQLVMPIELMSVNSEICGFTMPYIDNVCISKILQSDIDTKEKIKYLKEIGLLLEKIVDKEFIYPSDVHEGNFILNKRTNEINMVDMDSVVINNSYPSISKYLTFNSNLYDYHKYPLDEDDIHIPNKNTIYLSYIYMILNYVSGVNYIQDISLPDYYRYMQRLRDLGLSQELVDIFSNIYSECDNTNPVQLIESIPDNIKIFNYKGITK